MLDTVERLGRGPSRVEARLFLAPALGVGLRRRAAERAERAGIAALEAPDTAALAAFDVALVASGTATLECAVRGVPPLIVYRADRATELVARCALRVPHIGLPNLLLGRRAFPELVAARGVGAPARRQRARPARRAVRARRRVRARARPLARAARRSPRGVAGGPRGELVSPLAGLKMLEGASITAPAAAESAARTLSERWLLRSAIASSLLLFALRLHVGHGTGFGDAEALYASYALHPQPAYLDHPGLVGMVARLIGNGQAPNPQAAHLFAAVLATLVPWLGALGALGAGASRSGSVLTALALTWVPELAIGLFALTPDLLLAVTWLGALGLAALALSAEPRSFRALISTLGAGLLVGLAFLAKVSGALLGIALLVTLLSRGARGRLRTFAPWGALGLGLVLATPVVLWEAKHGWPMLTHRLVSSQAQAGFSLRNLGALLGGQLAYVSPRS